MSWGYGHGHAAKPALAMGLGDCWKVEKYPGSESSAESMRRVLEEGSGGQLVPVSGADALPVQWGSDVEVHGHFEVWISVNVDDVVFVQ